MTDEEKTRMYLVCNECKYAQIEGYCDVCVAKKMAPAIVEKINVILEKEKQQWIEEATEWLKHNIYDYFYWIEMEGESEANIKDTLFDDFKKSNGGKELCR